MAERTRRTTAAKKEERAQMHLKDHKWSIKRAYQFDNGNISFDMELDEGITLYRLMVVKTKNDNEFVSFPQYQSNGKWYNYIYLALTAEDQDDIINAVYDALDD